MNFGSKTSERNTYMKKQDFWRAWSKAWLREKLKGKIDAVIDLMKETGWSLEQAMSVLKIDDAYKDEIKAQLKKMQNNSQAKGQRLS